MSITNIKSLAYGDKFTLEHDEHIHTITHKAYTDLDIAVYESGEDRSHITVYGET